jgi:hypothetical protein
MPEDRLASERYLRDGIDRFLGHIRGNRTIYYPLGIFFILRFLLLFWMWGVRQVFPQPILPDPVFRPYLGVAIEENPWLEPWQRWDTLHYQAITERGYVAFEGALFVPPLYPLLMKAVGGLLGGNTLLAGILISNLAFLFSLVVFHRLSLDEMQKPEDAHRAVLYLAAFPSAFFFFGAYTESLFLLASLLTMAYARKDKYWQAGIWGCLAALTRLPGVLILLPLIYTALVRWVRERIWKPWIAVILTLVGSAVFPLYVWSVLHLPPWTPFKAQEGRSYGGLAFPGANILEAIQQIFKGNASLIGFVDLGFLLFFIVCLSQVWLRLPRIYGVFYLSFLGLYLIRTSLIDPLLSINRYVLVFFPAFMVMGTWGQKPIVHRTILYLSWIGLLYLSGQFALWGWAG